METNTNIADLTSVSFADFETKNSDENGSFETYEQCQAKHDMSMTLDLSLGQKAENLFAADQTPTPTRLIKNCDEVGLFEDLQHVNPFDIGFQRAAEQNAVGGHAMPGTPTRSEAPPTDGDSLHTPQVYPLDTPTVCAAAPPVSISSSPLDVPNVTNVEELLRTPEPTTAAQSSTNITTTATVNEGLPPLQLIQPQVITWVLPAHTLPITPAPAKTSKLLTSTTPVQKVRPFILPKPNTASNGPRTPTSATVPSSASLTPTSQLPIKERLKAILNNSNNKGASGFVTPPVKPKSTVKSDDEGMERKRAAASRYRDKVRNAQKELKEINAKLQQENRNLRRKIAGLERELQLVCRYNNNTAAAANQIHIPPSSIHLVINVPKMIVPASVPEPGPNQQ